eukprot:TRINITY_DN103156_c0_g1_i1.p1 TRINITY_DN103156_c0_g1~~TRINITY_DN103156_c0_g1_i1.p1  ORF type:complete len:335 (+),score=57.25 TRINITY_DN103156_c0_g1_i1:99-1007(+)
MTDVVAAEPLTDEEGDSMVIHMNPKTLEAIKMYDGDYCRLSNMGAAKFYGTITASSDAMEDCVHINDISIMCLAAAYLDTLHLSSIPLMWADTLEISCVGGELPPGGVDEVSELLRTYFGSCASRMVGLHQVFQVGSGELYFKVDRLIAKPYDESDVGDGTYGTVTLDPGSEHHCTMVIKLAPDIANVSPFSAPPWSLVTVASRLKLRASRIKQKGTLGIMPKQAVEDHKGQKSQADAAIEKFREWDIDGNGSITMQEMAVVLDCISPGDFTQADIEIMTTRADANRDGQIDMCEFIAWILK